MLSLSALAESPAPVADAGAIIGYYQARLTDADKAAAYAAGQLKLISDQLHAAQTQIGELQLRIDKLTAPDGELGHHDASKQAPAAPAGVKP